jgi:uncharacterized DUF497 family protein
VKISDFEWDEWNSQHIELGHGIEPEEAEEVFAAAPILIRHWLSQNLKEELDIE